MKKLIRIFCLLLTFVMVFSMISVAPVRAAEEADGETEPEIVTTSIEETEPTPESEPLIEVVTIPPEELTGNDTSLFSTRATYQDGKYRQRAVIWNTVGEKVNYTYNGKVNSYNTLLMHTLWYNGQWNAAYCIEPGKTLYVNSDYDEVENTGEDPWGKLDYNKQRGVGLALLYGYPNGIDSDDLKTQVAYQLATYLIVHEIILGWREDTHPFTRLDDSYFDVFGGGTPEKVEKLEITSEYHSSIHTKHLNNEDVWFAYNYISDSLAKHDLVPSFASSYKNFAPTHIMQANGDGTFSIILTDTNNILSAYEFVNTSDLTFTKSADGKSLTITTRNSNLSEVVVAPTRIVPSVEKSAYLIWNASNGSQELCTLKGAQSDPVPAYFKLQLPVGGIAIKKITDDGQNYGGWIFGVYADEACTELIYGPLSDPDSGYITIENVPVGDYWVKELGNIDKSIEEQYYCLSKNPQPVTVTSGYTGLVVFQNNKIRTGHLTVYKGTDTFLDSSGWTFALYYDEACQNLAYGPVETNGWGLALFESVDVGNYWLKELGNSNPELDLYYTCSGPNPQYVTILKDDTVNYYFENKLNTGTITVQKTDPYGNALPGAHLLLEWSVSGSIWYPMEYSTVPGFGNCSTPGINDGILVTDSSGCASFKGLAVGMYYRITEVQAPNGFQLLGDYAYEGTLTKNGEVVTVKAVNTPVFTLPHTGSHAMFGVTAGVVLCLLTCLGTVIYLKKKEF